MGATKTHETIAVAPARRRPRDAVDVRDDRPQGSPPLVVHEDALDADGPNRNRIAAVGVGVIAIYLGIVFEGMNVSFLVGWAFALAASANLPAILMLLFWKKTTARGIAASIVVGIVSSLALIAFSPELYALYGRNPLDAPIPLNNPGVVSIPLSFITLVVVSLMNQKNARV